MAGLLREALGESLRRVRTDQGRTLRAVSGDARVSLGYLSEIERGQKEASSELLAAICAALDVEVADLLLDAHGVLRGPRIDAGTRVVIPAPRDVVMASSTA